jgi:hypothetical protein
VGRLGHGPPWIFKKNDYHIIICSTFDQIAHRITFLHPIGDNLCTFSLVWGPSYTPTHDGNTTGHTQRRVGGCRVTYARLHCMIMWLETYHTSAMQEGTHFRLGATSKATHLLWEKRRDRWPTLDTYILQEQNLWLVKLLVYLLFMIYHVTYCRPAKKSLEIVCTSWTHANDYFSKTTSNEIEIYPLLGRFVPMNFTRIL